MLTYFVELPGDRAAELFARSGVLESLQRQQAGVALAMLDLSEDRRELMAELARRQIPITAWLLLSKEEGYWLTVDNPGAATARYREVRDWAREAGLPIICFGLDVETPLADSLDLFEQGRKALWRLLSERRGRAEVREGARAYDVLLDEIRRDGHAVESYQFPLIVDERRARSTLLQRALGFVDVKTDREVLMLYRTLLPAPFDAVLIDAFGPEADAIAVGITGGGVDFVLEQTGRLLDYDSLVADLRRAGRYTRNRYIFSLEGCVDAGYFERLAQEDLSPALSPVFGASVVRAARWALRAALAGEAFYDRWTWPGRTT